ncbi:MAG: DNA repair protein RecN [Prevotellaceae bacterium]|nr:DNA repair protein RecN [Prevotellaceae bacterium]
MLRQLHIQNFTLIEELKIDFHAGFSVITGETGAGKSIILGAIALLLGNRADIRQVRSGAKKCVIEAHFDLSHYHFNDFFEENDLDFDPDDCILRREVSASGKSRAFINDMPVSLALMRELGNQLIDIHSQHQNLLLQKDDFTLEVVDTLAHNETVKVAYRQAFAQRNAVGQQLDTLKEQIERSRENEDYTRFLCQELDKAQLTEGLQEQLEQEAETLSHAEEIKTVLYETATTLQGDEGNVVEKLKTTANQLHHLTAVFPAVAELADRLDSTYIEVKDIASEADALTDGIEYRPDELAAINERLDIIYSLQRKHHVATVEELMALHNQLLSQLEAIDHGEERVKALEDDFQRLDSLCREQAAKLTATRIRYAREVEKALRERLVPLGIPNVRFEVEVAAKPLANDGADKIQFLFCANKEGMLQPIGQIASGGEIARVMLSLKALISGAVKLPTIIFDEIDTGVSGRVAEKMAQMMHEMGEQHRQVISITHLPQIAAQGRYHYKVKKEDVGDTTLTSMRQLNTEERIEEIAQMLSGSDITPAAIENAKSLLGI